MTERNWAGNYAYRAGRLHRPATLEQVQELVAAAPRLRVLGSRHSFNDIADSAELVSLEGLPAEVAVDRAAGTVSVPAGLRYGELAGTLAAEGLALANLASLPHISVGGAVATATHGSGDANGNLATAVAGLELVAGTGELLTAARGDPDFDGLVVGLGALGAVTRLTLDVEPDYRVRQRAFEGLPWAALLDHFDEVTSAGYSVSLFTRWGPTVDQVWVKTRVTGAPEEVRGELFGAVPATQERHPILGLDPVNCTRQLGVPGPWSDRLPHFRMGFTPSSGEELQSEYHLPRAQAVAALQALRALAGVVRPVLQVSELRTVAADRLWMSPQHGRDTLSVHFTWHKDWPAVRAVLAEVEAALAPFGARPHWGKLFLAEAADLAPRYPRLGDFTGLAGRLDPRGVFVNDWLRRHVLGG
ncbi:MAG TPA: D-arabinono-1,4-lactone oxidase [Actinomycetota bacterium]|nr:D-arabinono-1,4-lactone oxidase [Actinomycetota bacterium]